MAFHLGDLMFLNFYKVKKVSQWLSKSNKLYPDTITSDSHAIGSQNRAGKQGYKTCPYSLVIFPCPDPHWSKYMKMHKHWDTFWATVLHCTKGGDGTNFKQATFAAAAVHLLELKGTHSHARTNESWYVHHYFASWWSLATISDEKVQAIIDWLEPRKVKDIQSFLGFANFYCWFIYNYLDIVVPLTRLTCKDVPWNFLDECWKSFLSLWLQYLDIGCQMFLWL